MALTKHQQRHPSPPAPPALLFWYKTFKCFSQGCAPPPLLVVHNWGWYYEWVAPVVYPSHTLSLAVSRLASEMQMCKALQFLKYKKYTKAIDALKAFEKKDKVQGAGSRRRTRILVGQTRLGRGGRGGPEVSKWPAATIMHMDQHVQNGARQLWGSPLAPVSSCAVSVLIGVLGVVDGKTASKSHRCQASIRCRIGHNRSAITHACPRLSANSENGRTCETACNI